MNTKTIARVKRILQKKRITYGQIARRADASYNMVYLTINGLSKSPRIVKAIEKITGESLDGDAKR